MQEEGTTQTIINYSYQSTNEFFDLNGDKIARPKFTKGEISPYIQHGLDEDWTVGGSLSLQSVSSNGVAGNVQDLDKYQAAYAEFFARYEIYDGGDYTVSVEPRVKLPIEQDASINPEGSRPIPELRVSYGEGLSVFEEHDSFGEVSATYRLRSADELGDMIKIETTLGARPFEDYPILLLAQSSHEVALTDIASTASAGNYELFKVQLSAAYEFDEGLTVQAGLISNLYGKNTAAGNGLIISSWFSF